MKRSVIKGAGGTRILRKNVFLGFNVKTNISYSKIPEFYHTVEIFSLNTKL